MLRLVMAIGLVFYLASSSIGQATQEVKLNWVFKASGQWGSEATFRFLKVWPVGDSLKFDILVHNTNKKNYECISIAATENTLHMDDELGNEYRGATVSFRNGLDNKLAINQRKRFIISIPKPSNEVDVANLHFGLHVANIESNLKCPEPTGNHKMNFHKFDWDVGQFRK